MRDLASKNKLENNQKRYLMSLLSSLHIYTLTCGDHIYTQIQKKTLWDKEKWKSNIPKIYRKSSKVRLRTHTHSELRREAETEILLVASFGYIVKPISKEDSNNLPGMVVYIYIFGTWEAGKGRSHIWDHSKLIVSSIKGQSRLQGEILSSKQTKNVP